MDTAERKIEVNTVRDVMPVRGARFYRDAEGTVIFTFVIDTGNVVGPRKATEADSLKHPLAWSAFVTSDTPPEVVEVVPDARDYEPAAEPVTVVEEKDMSAFAAVLEPAPEPPPKRKYTRRVA